MNYQLAKELMIKSILAKKTATKMWLLHRIN